MAWAIVTDAGTPYRLCAAIAPGAIALMKACWLEVSGTCADDAGGLFLVYDGAAGVEEVLAVLAGPAAPSGATRPAEAGSSPGMAAPPPACVPAARWVPAAPCVLALF
jgi:hypothetical protein